MLEELQGHLEAMRELVGGVEPATLCPEDARRLLELAAGVERLGLGLKLAVAPRALVDAPWCLQGYPSEATWLAEQLRSSVPEAMSVKERAEALEQLPALARASRCGSLSSAEVRALTAAASADPSAQDELLESAGTLGVHEVLRYSRILARAAHESDPGHRQRLSQTRFLRFWTDPEGLLRFSGGVVEDDGLELLFRVRSMAEHLRSEVARAEEPDPGDKALAADALVSLVRGDKRWASFGGPGAQLAARPEVLIVVAPDTEAPAGAGQLCHLPGVGPVSLRALEAFIGDARLATVITDGVDVAHVTHHGRTVPAHLQCALRARDRSCVVPNCRVEIGLEIDHWQIPFARGGPTELWNLARLCKTHHRMKTYDGYVLSGGPGKWQWHPPPD